MWNGIQTNKYIVLDLDSTLVNTFPDLHILEKLNVYSDYSNYELRKRIYTIDLHDVIESRNSIYTRMWGVYRPGWSQFGNFYFDILKELLYGWLDRP